VKEWSTPTHRGSPDPDPWSSEYIEPFKDEKLEQARKEQEQFENLIREKGENEKLSARVTGESGLYAVVRYSPITPLDK
jgi:hypothetical protein